MGEFPAALARRLERRLGALTLQVVASLVERVPLYSQLPQEQLSGEIADVCRHNLQIFVRTLVEARPPGPDELAVIQLSAARRAHERVPLDAVLSAYHVGLLVTWQAVQEEAAGGERDALLSVATRAMDYIAQVTALVAAAYLEEREALSGEERGATQTLVNALLAGNASEHLATEAGHRLAPSYMVLALGFGTSEDERTPSVTGAVAARRKLRRIENRLERTMGTAVPAVLGVTGGVVLLPVDRDPPSTLTDPRLLVEELSAAAGAPVTAAVAFRPGLEGVPAAASEADEILRIAIVMGLAPQLYRVEDLLFEHALGHDQESLDHLAALLDPLQSGPDLLSTLDAYLQCDLDRRRAAAVLHIHPNSLDYRLRRVRALTGCDVGTTKGIQLLGAALVARRLTASPTTDG
ncbi:MAG TPA: helix-turn-helix domain-containing protein [Verrucomicrobiae bacterium]|nr:helix-turn-helix domain-containing protein [Verrucomicrobiae bacterium]